MGERGKNYYFYFVEIIISSLRKLKENFRLHLVDFLSCLQQDHYNPNVIQLKEPRKLSSKCKQLFVCLHPSMILLFLKQKVVIAANVLSANTKGFYYSSTALFAWTYEVAF